VPYHNAFRHQEYSADPPHAPYEVVRPGAPASEHSTEFADSLRRLGQQLWQARVRTIVLVHGTFLGADLTGLIAQIERYAPQFARSLRDWEKNAVDSIMGDLANYTDHFAARLDAGINASLTNRIRVLRFTWSSENHHLGRADGAVRLLSELIALQPAPSDRLLLCGHSHGGNVLAILTHLLHGTSELRHRFFQATRLYYQRPFRRVIDLPVWPELADRLEHDPPAWRPDIVTFGTPIRYGWETAGYRSLLHFVNHRLHADKPAYLAPFPPSLDQLARGSAGDMIQQIGVAGTNFPVNICSWRDWVVEARLHRLMQYGDRRRNAWERLKLGTRVAAEGKTLLVDYYEGDPASAQLLAGHAVYTKLIWLPFHLQQIVNHSLTPAPNVT
jgi:hypothetical protein